MSKVVAKILKNQEFPAGGVFLKPFLDLSDEFVKIIIFLTSNEPGKIEEVDGVKYYHSPIANRKKVRRQAQFVSSVLIENKVNIIHCDQHSSTVIGVRAKKITGIPTLFSHVHGPNMCRGVSRKIFYFTNRIHITKLVACSEFIRRNVLATFPGYGEDKVVTFANGIDLTVFNNKPISPEIIDTVRSELGVLPIEKMFLTLCRLSSDKNLDLLFNAFSHVCKKNHTIKLFVAGKGRRKNELLKQIANLGMEGRIVLLGFRTDVKELLASCDFYIQPSHSEGLSVSILEAAAMGKPIIFTGTGGAEVLEGICDQFILTPDIEGEITTAIENICALDSEDVKKIGVALSERVQNRYTHEIMTAKLAELYANA